MTASENPILDYIVVSFRRKGFTPVVDEHENKFVITTDAFKAIVEHGEKTKLELIGPNARVVFEFDNDPLDIKKVLSRLMTAFYAANKLVGLV